MYIFLCTRLSLAFLSRSVGRRGGGGNEGCSSGGGFDGGSGVGRSKENYGVVGFKVAVDAPGATGTADVGPLCTNDFKISARTAVVCEEVAHFATPILPGGALPRHARR